MNIFCHHLLAMALGFIPAYVAVGISTAGLSDISIGYSTGGKSICVSGYTKIPISVNGTKLDYMPPSADAAVIESMVERFQATNDLLTTVPNGTQLIQGDYQIYCKLCLPSSSSKATSVKTVQLLTHGAPMDHSYWDISPGHSYIDAATEAGYATLSYDQLGVGKSAHPDPIQVVQATSQAAITHALVQLLRGAKIGNYKFDSVVGVGHSSGSTITQAVTIRYPSDFDAVILTGISMTIEYLAISVAAFNLIQANSDPSGRFEELPDGYLTPQTSAGIQFAFYRWPNYNTTAFKHQVANKQTNTIGYMLTIVGAFAKAPDYVGPVDVVLGENDFLFCGGNCTHPQNQAALLRSTNYPNSSSGSQHYIVAGSGHCINAHNSASAGFEHMIKFLQSNGIY
ncbi:hypothetical protein N7507_003236 [Penicillium longicatenatum]|nr:hypothetical protein N7507_003236 [Penicillium longicatenatum]